MIYNMMTHQGRPLSNLERILGRYYFDVPHRLTFRNQRQMQFKGGPVVIHLFPSVEGDESSCVETREHHLIPNLQQPLSTTSTVGDTDICATIGGSSPTGQILLHKVWACI